MGVNPDRTTSPYNTIQGHCVANDKFCFFPIPKCASMSLCHAMIDQGWRHTHLDQEEGLLELTTAVMLRDPLERFISAYNYPGWHTAPGVYPSAEECIGMMDGHFAPQSWYMEGLHPDICGDIENMEEFAKALGLPYPMPLRNPTWTNIFIKQYSPELVDKIKEFYYEDYLLRSQWL